MTRHLLIATVLFAPALAHAAPDVGDLEYALQANASQIFDYAGRPDETRIDNCLDAYAQLHAKGVPDTDTVTVPYDHDKNPLTKGTYTIAHVREYCAKQQAAYTEQAAADEARGKLGRAAESVLQQAKDIDDHPEADLKLMDRYVADCVAAVDAARAAGMPDDLAIEVSDNGEDYPWKGTLGAMKHDVCDRGTETAKKGYEKRFGPFIKAGMKNDKLAMVMESFGGELFEIPGGESTMDPAKLMKANVWFDGSVGDECAPGKKTETIHRYQFDKDQKVVKTTNKQFCGDPPRSFYR